MGGLPAMPIDKRAAAAPPSSVMSLRRRIIRSPRRRRREWAARRCRPDATRRNTRHPGWVALGLKVSPETYERPALRKPFAAFPRWREHLSPSSHRTVQPNRARLPGAGRRFLVVDHERVAP